VTSGWWPGLRWLVEKKPWWLIIVGYLVRVGEVSLPFIGSTGSTTFSGERPLKYEGCGS